MDSNTQVLLHDFQKDSLNIVRELNEILEQAEESIAQAKRLEDFGQRVDRIMGGARSLHMMLPKSGNSGPWLEQIGNFSEICKAVGYKASQLTTHDELYTVCVAFLMDATEILENLIHNLFSPTSPKQKMHYDTFLDRLKWINQHFSSELRHSVAVSGGTPDTLSQEKIDELMKKLGI